MLNGFRSYNIYSHYGGIKISKVEPWEIYKYLNQEKKLRENIEGIWIEWKWKHCVSVCATIKKVVGGPWKDNLQTWIIRKWRKKSQINDLSFHFKIIERIEWIQPKLSLRKDIIKE